MKLNYIYGDIFEQANAVIPTAIVNMVNCKGISGKGLALQFKINEPHNYKEYNEFCRKNLLKPGNLFITETSNKPYRFIINAATKNDWKNPSNMIWINNICKELIIAINTLRITSIIIPPLGAGLGKLHTLNVKDLILNYINEKSVPKLINLYLINFKE